MQKQISTLCVFMLTWVFVVAQNNLYKEKYRPQFHFSPAKNWTNDPNGLVYFDGRYHFGSINTILTANRWGHMSWAHSVEL